MVRVGINARLLPGTEQRRADPDHRRPFFDRDFEVVGHPHRKLGNRPSEALGGEIARGRSLAEVEAATPMVAEGVRTVSSVLRMARDRGVTMPICEEVAAVLFEGKPVAESLVSLLAREPRREEEGVSRA